MKCENYRIQISALKDDELDAAEMADLKAHLEVCAECRKELKRTGLLEEIIKDWKQPETVTQQLTEDGWLAVAERIRSQDRYWWSSRAAWLAAAAAMVVISLSCWLVLPGMRRTDTGAANVVYGRLTPDQQMSANLASAVLLGTAGTDLDGVVVSSRSKEMLGLVVGPAAGFE